MAKTNTEEMQEFHEGIIEKVDFGDTFGGRFGQYSKYIIQERALPDVRDGLKPVQRRVLYGMFEEGNTHDKAYRKSAKSVGSIMGNYHPHGDSSIYDAMARMSQWWKVGLPLVDMHGNNGSMDGDPPAAMRYTEARLTSIVSEFMMSGINKKGIVPMKDNFDETLQEPVVLPVQFPNLLVNGASGISSGYATEIPPHNLAETLRGAIALEENPDLTLEELVQIIPAPDFPTGGVVTSAKDMMNVYDSGKGAIQLRSKYHIETASKGKSKTKLQYIVIDEVPFGVNKSVLVRKIAELIEDKKIVGVRKVLDESDRTGLRISIECDADADLQVILAYLMKNTPLQTNFNMNMVVILDRKPKKIGLREALVSFNKFRKETKIKELNFDREKFLARLHIVEGFLRLVTILPEVVAMIQKSKGKLDARDKLVSDFGFTELQANEIVVMQLYRVSNVDKLKYEEEKAKLEKNIAIIDGLLSSPKKLSKRIVKEYQGIIDKYGTPRKTEVVMEEETWEVRKVDTIAEEDVYVCVTKEGFIKRSSPRSYNSATKNGLGNGDEVIFEGQSTTKNNILIFTDKGHFINIPTHDIEDMRWGDVGKHISTIVPLGEGETIINAMSVDFEADKDKYILMAKNDGKVKRTPVSEYEIISKFNKLYDAVKKIKEDSPLRVVGTWLVTDEGSIGFEDSEGKRMYFNINEINPTGLKTEGMRGIHLKDNELIGECLFVEQEHLMPQRFTYRKRGSKGVAKK